MTKRIFETPLLAIAALSCSVQHAAATDTTQGEYGRGRAILIPASELVWKQEAEGVEMAQVDGDPSRGPSHFFTRLAPGHAAKLHHHNADHFGTVVSGTLVLIVDGKEHALPPGSFFGFTGKKKHATRCEAEAPCVFSTDARGIWDTLSDVETEKQ